MQTPHETPFLVIGTRGSPLALAQSEEVRRRLAAAHGVEPARIAIRTISTAGDRSQAGNLPLGEIGGKGLFSKEIEAQLLQGSIDIAVHSAKDMASVLPEGLVMPVFLPREDVRDAFLSLVAASLDDLPTGARIGTSSLRRRAQLRHVRPDLAMLEFRGNVGTRLQKLADGVADATLLAAAGLRRLGHDRHLNTLLDPRQFPPAPAQGAIGIEYRQDDQRVAAIVAPLHHAETGIAVRAERAMLRVLDGSCRTPIAALSTLAGDGLTLLGQVLSPDGRECFTTEAIGAAAAPEAVGEEVGHALIARAGPDFLRRMKAGA